MNKKEMRHNLMIVCDTSCATIVDYEENKETSKYNYWRPRANDELSGIIRLARLNNTISKAEFEELNNAIWYSDTAAELKEAFRKVIEEA